MKRIIAILLLVTICLTTLASCSVVDAVVDNVYGYLDQIFDFEKFDYLTSDLTQYISFSEDYKNFEIKIPIAKPRYGVDVEVSKIVMLRNDKPKEAWVTKSVADLEINPGDVAYIYYRGYLVDDEGNKQHVDNMSNFHQEPYALEIGSNSFVPGFELSMVGEKLGDYARFEKITSGIAGDAKIAYISYTKETIDEKGRFHKEHISDNGYSEPKRIDFSDDTVDAKYGEGFVDFIKTRTIGEKHTEVFRTIIDGMQVTYSDVKVQFVTNCEDEGNWIDVDCYFPYNYGGNADLKNQDAVFEVYVQYIDKYYKETPEFDDDYVQAKIESKEIDITLDELNAYAGDTLVEKYNSYAKELLNKTYESEYNRMTSEAAWDHILSIANVEKYPTKKVDVVYLEYAEWIEHIYTTSGGKIYNSYYGQYEIYTDLNAFANACLGINSYSNYYQYGDTAWQYYFYDIAKDDVKEKMVIFYILRAENLLPDEATLDLKVEEAKVKLLDWYNNEYLPYENNILTSDELFEVTSKSIKVDVVDSSKELNTNEGSDGFKIHFVVGIHRADIHKPYKAYKISGNDENYFIDQAYRNILMENVVEWVNVTTLYN